MKQVHNTEVGQIILCEECFASLNQHSLSIGQGQIQAKDVTATLPEYQKCDICGYPNISKQLKGVLPVPSSTELIALAEKEWETTMERNADTLGMKKESWISGFIAGYINRMGDERKE